ncbi:MULTISPECIES: type II toxin-antitoxin system VapC family toxin [Microbacterium]|uniref:Ribonuclease VapC n=1 Tax=Microbacterium profundi TaxID=450380 RepID=A0ABV3LE74_9MICO|nr:MULTISPECIES: PIN domain-containing protein [Microbacterium]MCE7480716.1 PIN domain-containing protein [Microbacterium profundi]
MIVLDASVMIAHLLEGDAHATATMELLDTEEELAMHQISIAESLVGPAKRNVIDVAERAIGTLGVERLQAPIDEPRRLALLRAETGLKMPDCCVLAGAESNGATLATFDRRLADVARERGVEVVGA